jgi:hypothetical protein
MNQLEWRRGQVRVELERAAQLWAPAVALQTDSSNSNHVSSLDQQDW